MVQVTKLKNSLLKYCLLWAIVCLFVRNDVVYFNAVAFALSGIHMFTHKHHGGSYHCRLRDQIWDPPRFIKNSWKMHFQHGNKEVIQLTKLVYVERFPQCCNKLSIAYDSVEDNLLLSFPVFLVICKLSLSHVLAVDSKNFLLVPAACTNGVEIPFEGLKFHRHYDWKHTRKLLR